MKTKVIAGALIILILSTLIYAYFGVREQEPLLKISGTPLTIQQIEPLTDSLILTYENRTRASITALNIQQNVTLIGTNHNFPLVMNYRMLHGRFFSQDASQYRHTVAVLNERAAFQIFGTAQASGNVFTLNQTPHIVMGVIDDRDEENLNVYVPASILGYNLSTVVINLDISPYPVEQIINKLQQVGITYEDYRFVNFLTTRMAVIDSIFIVLSLLLVLGLTIITKKSWSYAKKEVLILQHLHQEVYTMELIKKPPFWRLIVLSIIIICINIASAALITDVFRRTLMIWT